eukprot:NODE_64_length_24072_cov_0.332541.p2 type:complete len:1125 gc:universal NODE_64_length_24072_cov_0.332541:4810-8184(+)
MSVYSKGMTAKVKDSLYTIVEIESESISSVVYKVSCNNTTYALKSWKNKEKFVYNEIQASKNASNNPHVVEYVNSTIIPVKSDVQGLLILEYLPGGTLKSFIENQESYLNDLLVLQTFTNLTSAISFLHSINPPIYHLNINTSNIMLIDPNDPKSLKLIDFALSSTSPIYVDKLKPTQIKNYIQYFTKNMIVQFSSPEILNFRFNITYACDIWSLGCILYNLLFLKHCFNTANEVLSSEFRMCNDVKYPPFFDILLSKLLLKDPKLRLKAGHVLNECSDYLSSLVDGGSHTHNENDASDVVIAGKVKLHATHLLDIPNFKSVKKPLRHINFQFPLECCICNNSVVYTIPMDASLLCKHNIKADLAIYNPASHLLITTDGSVVDVYNVNLKQRILSQSLSNVQFMSWLDDDLIAILTMEVVYHFNITTNELTEMAGIFSSVMEHQIVYYDVDDIHDPSWLLLTSPNPADPQFGQIQLHSMLKSGSQIIPGELARLTNSNSDVLLMLINRGQTHSYLHIVAVVPGKQPSSIKLPIKNESIMTLDVHADDCYMSTNTGRIIIYNFIAKSFRYNSTVLKYGLIKSFINDDAYYGITVNGKIFSITESTSVESSVASTSSTVADTASNTLDRTASAPDSSVRGAAQRKSITPDPRNKTKEGEKATSIRSKLNSSSTRNSLKSVPSKLEDTDVTKFNSLLTRISANQAVDANESVLFCKYGNTLGLSQLVFSYISENKLTISEELGDELIRVDNKPLALECYQKSNSHDKVCRLMADDSKYSELIEYLDQVEYKPVDESILQELVFVDEELAFKYGLKYYSTELEVIENISRIMMESNENTLATSFLVKHIIDAEEYGSLQTKLIKLIMNENVSKANELLKSEKYTKYDKWSTSVACIDAQLYDTAISLYHSRELMFNKNDILSSNPIYHELANHLFNKANAEYWQKAIDLLDTNRSTETRDYALVDISEDSKFGCLMRSLLDGNSLNSQESLFSLLESLISNKKLYWLYHLLDFVMQGELKKNKSIQTLYALCLLLADHNVEEIENLTELDYLTTSMVAQKMGNNELGFDILNRFKEYAKATELLMELDMTRALDYANEINNAEVWEMVGKKIVMEMRSNKDLYRILKS